MMAINEGAALFAAWDVGRWALARGLTRAPTLDELIAEPFMWTYEFATAWLQYAEEKGWIKDDEQDDEQEIDGDTIGREREAAAQEMLGYDEEGGE